MKQESFRWQIISNQELSLSEHFSLTVGFISKVALLKPNKGKTIEKNLHRSTVSTSGIENKTNGNDVECTVEASYCDYWKCYHMV